MSKILLFDVDGTLVNAGGAGRRAFGRALDVEFGPAVHPREDHLAGIRLDGMTDGLVIRQVMKALELPFDDAVCNRVFVAYLRNLPAELEAPGYSVLPGVAALLSALQERAVPLGLCTGNVMEGARLKLARGGLDRFFGFGAGAIFGFAEDGEARADIVRAAVRRASKRFGREVSPQETLVVGDTPRDVEAAHAVGCPVFAVATGRYSIEELMAAGADAAGPSLEEPWVLEALSE